MMLGLEALILECAPGVAPQTMAAIISVESGGNPWQIGNNTLKKPHRPTPKSYEEAVAVAKALISRGDNIDIGLAQINSANLRRLNLSVEDVLIPCNNIKTGGKILKDFYIKASGKFGHGQQALFHALSGYNTGSLYAGTGYVKKIINAAYKGLPANSNAVIPQRPVLAYQPGSLYDQELNYQALPVVTVNQNMVYRSAIIIDNSQGSEILAK